MFELAEEKRGEDRFTVGLGLGYDRKSRMIVS